MAHVPASSTAASGGQAPRSPPAAPIRSPMRSKSGVKATATCTTVRAATKAWLKNNNRRYAAIVHNFVLAASNMMIGVSIRMANRNEAHRAPRYAVESGRRSRHPPRMDLRPPSATRRGRGESNHEEHRRPAAGVRAAFVDSRSVRGRGTRSFGNPDGPHHVLRAGTRRGKHALNNTHDKVQQHAYRSDAFGVIPAHQCSAVSSSGCRKRNQTIALAVKRRPVTIPAAALLVHAGAEDANTITGKNVLAAKPKANATTSATNPGGSIPNQPATTTAPTMAMPCHNSPFQRCWEQPACEQVVKYWSTPPAANPLRWRGPPPNHRRQPALPPNREARNFWVGQDHVSRSTYRLVLGVGGFIDQHPFAMVAPRFVRSKEGLPTNAAPGA